MSASEKLPLVYACSGASSAAQMANYLAVKLDRLCVAEMSCIAGVGGDVKPLVNTAKSGRPIVALDGCSLHCVAHALRRHGLRPDRHYDLSEQAIEKRMHEDFDPGAATRVLQRILDDRGFPGRAGPAPAPATVRDSGPVSPPSPSASAADGEILEGSSPPCYLSELGHPVSGVQRTARSGPGGQR